MAKTLLLLLLLGSCATAAAAEPPPLRLTMLDVGLGEALLLACPGGHTQVLIDAADTDEHYPGAPAQLRAGLAAALKNDVLLETVIITHPHPDHLGGLLPLLADDTIRIGRIIEQGTDFRDSTLDDELRKSAAERGIPLEQPKPGAIDLCPSSGVSAELLALPAERRAKLGCPDNLNDCSLKLRIEYAGLSLLLLADATQTWEREALADNSLREKLSASVLKVGHHASPYSTSKELLEAVQPSFVLISVGLPGRGATDRLGYPAEATLKRIQAHFEHRPSTRTIQGCRREGVVCRWQPVPLPDAVRATPVDGTIELTLPCSEDRQRICLRAGKK